MQEMYSLRLHSDFSLLKSMVPVEAYAGALKTAGYLGGAITDQDCGFGWVDFYTKMKKAQLKPILGSHLTWNFGSRAPSGLSIPPLGMSLLVMNSTGYRNLCKILSAFSFKTLDHQKLLDWSDGLSLLIPPGHPASEAKRAFLKQWDSRRLFFELHRFQNHSPQTDGLTMAQEFGARCIATQPVLYLKPEDHRAYEILLSIGAGTNLEDESRPKPISRDFYLKSYEEFSRLYQDRPEALTNLQVIADSIDFGFKGDTYYLPKIGKDDEVDELFVQKCREGLEQRLQLVREQQAENFLRLETEYRSRLEIECEIIKKMKFAGYFLIVADFIQWSKAQDIPVGPGRGSGAGSLAAYSLGITDIDPIKYKLLFERFLNPERVSMPDFDVDFCIKGREAVIQYVRQKYDLSDEALPPEERLKVGQIITYGKMKSKAVIRDVGRALGLPYSDVDSIAKMIPNVLNITLREAYELEPGFKALRERDPKADELLGIAEQLEGLNRHSSVHAAGVVISDQVLTHYLPLYQGSDSEIVVQFEMKAVEKIGLVKFDFLGLRNLTVIQECIRLTGEQIDLLKIDYNDPKVMAEISTGETVGIFQLESSGMRDVIRRLQPSVFEDLIAIVALYRPGPLEGGMVDDFILRKRGQKEIDYPHPVLEAILQETYGVFVYQEQVMGTANLMAGFSLGEADLLRRAMGKKIAEEMALQREKFVTGSVSKGFDEKLSQSIFDLMSEFAKYGFNKSHAAAYAMVTFQTAYLKTYYPQAFFAALLSSESEDIETLGSIIRTAQKRGLQVLPPDVNSSSVEFALEAYEGQTAIRFGLSGIKNLGRNVAEAIVENRQRKGPFKDVQDFFLRISAQVLNRRQAECLVRSGALDGFGLTRSSIFASLDSLVGVASSLEKSRAAGQKTLFAQKPQMKTMEEWADRIRLNDEKSLLGTYMTGHPMAQYEPILRNYKSHEIAQLLQVQNPSKEKEYSVAGLITSRKEILTKKGSKMAFFTLEDEDSQIEVVVFSDLFQKRFSLTIVDRLVLVRGQISKEGGSTRLLAREITDLSQNLFQEIQLRLDREEKLESLPELVEFAKHYPGELPLKVRVKVDSEVQGKKLQSSHVTIESSLRVQAHPQLLNWMEGNFGKGSVQLIEAGERKGDTSRNLFISS
jgi:DNA polymerase-3 subunit alpha